MRKPLATLPPWATLAGVFVASLVPFLVLELFSNQLGRVLDKSAYLVIHNVTEFFSIMVSLSVFGVGWYTYEQSRDRRGLFLGVAFLGIGLMDFMHTFGNAAMPAFITANSSNKSTQFWIAARLFQAVCLLASAWVPRNGRSPWLGRAPLMSSVLAVCGLVFAGVTFFPDSLPATFVQGVGLTPFKKGCEYLVILLLLAAGTAYWREMTRSGDRVILYYLAAFVVGLSGELVFASYKAVFDTYNVVGHIYKIISFSLIYKGNFVTSVSRPYVELHQANARLLHEVEERRQAELALEAYSARLERSNRELEDFAFVASHDLQEPIRKIRTFAGRLLGADTDFIGERGGEYLGRIARAAGRMQELVAALLDYSRLSTRQQRMTMIDLRKTVEEAVTDLGPLREETQASISIGTLPAMEADPVQMRQLFQNLIGNALKYRRDEPPKIEVQPGTVKANGVCEILVQDNGIGFEERYLDRIFRPFQRLHGTGSPFKGTGMGLAICHRIVERHGGSITARSKPGVGSVFIVRLPVRQAQANDQAA